MLSDVRTDASSPPLRAERAPIDSERLLRPAKPSHTVVEHKSFDCLSNGLRNNDCMTTWVIAISSSLAYALSYFWRYPIFILPEEDLERHVLTLSGKDFDLQACFSLAFMFGFALAKAPASSFAASRFFFAHRFTCIASALAGSMLIECVGIFIFASSPALQVVAVFVSSLLSSVIFGLLLTYLEGRRATESMLAVMTGMFIYAGNLSRGTASALLDIGVPSKLMPLLIGVVTCPFSCMLLLLTHKAPRPSGADQAARMRRSSMSLSARIAFLRDWAVGVSALVLAYALLMGLRYMRDLCEHRLAILMPARHSSIRARPFNLLILWFAVLLDSRQLCSASLGVTKAPEYIFLIADLPAAALSICALLYLSTIKNNRQALLTMLSFMLFFTSLGLLSTWLFQHGVIGGVAWQLLIGSSSEFTDGLFSCSNMLFEDRTSPHACHYCLWWLPIRSFLSDFRIPAQFS
ncbi:MAG: hypothetical protein SGPRY_000531 [Prymnesium sp.]